MTRADFCRRVTEDVRRAFDQLPCPQLPIIDVRDFGKGEGKTFDVEAFIASHAFTEAQVRAIYRFLCFMACEGDEGVDEEQLPAMRKWRESARRRAAL